MVSKVYQMKQICLEGVHMLLAGMIAPRKSFGCLVVLDMVTSHSKVRTLTRLSVNMTFKLLNFT